MPIEIQSEFQITIETGVGIRNEPPSSTSNIAERIYDLSYLEPSDLRPVHMRNSEGD